MRYITFDIEAFTEEQVDDGYDYHRLASWSALDPTRARVAVRNLMRRHPDAVFEVTRVITEDVNPDDDMMPADDTLDIIDRESR
jgi:hypothetical protein